MGFFSKIGRGLKKIGKGIARGVGGVVKGAVGVAGQVVSGFLGGGEQTVRIAVEREPTGKTKVSREVRPPTSPIPAGRDRTKLGEAEALGGNRMLLLIAAGIAALFLFTRR